jgi:hypothetical protein
MERRLRFGRFVIDAKPALLAFGRGWVGNFIIEEDHLSFVEHTMFYGVQVLPTEEDAIHACHVLGLRRINHYVVSQYPDGTIIETTVFGVIPHPGLLDHAADGTPIVYHNSKEHGESVATSLGEFAGDGVIRLVSAPANPEQSWVRLSSARHDVALRVPWSPDNNCQDSISRANTGHDGSPTRDALVAVGVVTFAAWLASRD